MVFNVIARNQDHTKNIAFLMSRSGTWSLSPAYDVTWSHNPRGDWTSRHQVTINGKRADLERADLEAVADQLGIRKGSAIIDDVTDAVAKWPSYAADVEVSDDLRDRAEASHRIHLR